MTDGGLNVIDRAITFLAGERRLQGRVFWSPESSPPPVGLLFIHGLGSSQRGYHRRAARTVKALGIVCLTFDLSGHGLSPGSLDDLTARDHLVDALAAYDRLATEVADGGIGICGASYGAYLAAQAVAHRPVERLLLRAPALIDDDLFDVPVNERRGRSHGHAPALLASLNAFGGDVLVLESERDEVISHRTITTYLRACLRGYHSVIPDASHSLGDGEWDDVFISEVIRWFERPTSGSDTPGGR